MSKTTRNIVYGAVLAAMAVVLTFFVRFPIFPSAPFLEYDMGDVPLFFGALLTGPWVGLLITLVTCIVQGFTVSAGSGVLGIIMHFFATGSFVVCAGLIAQKKKTTRLIPAFLCGAVTQILITIPLNLIITPVYSMGGDALSGIAECAKAVFRGFFIFPKGAAAALSGAVAAVAFCVAFLITMVYTMDVKHKGEKKKSLPAKSVVFGCIAGLIYGSLALLCANIMLGSLSLPDGVRMVLSMMTTVIIPFNAIKAGANAILAGVLYFILGKRITV